MLTLRLGIARAPDDHADLSRKAAVALFAVAGRGGGRAARLALHLMGRGFGGDGLGGKRLGGRVGLLQAGLGDLLSAHGSAGVQPRLHRLQEKGNTWGVGVTGNANQQQQDAQIGK